MASSTTDPSRHPSAMDPAGPSRRRRSGWLLAGAVGITVALLTAVFGFAMGRDPAAIRSVLLGKPAPRFTLTSLDGTETVSLASFRGQVVVVNFWASWCADCRTEQPALAAAWQRYRDRGVVFLGVSFEDSSGTARAFADQVGMRWPLLGDPGSHAAVDFGLSGVPETYVIGPAGTIVGVFKRTVSYLELSNDIERALSAAPA